MSSNIRLTRNCKFCEQNFTAKTTVTQYCSDVCAKRAYKKRMREEKLTKISTVSLPNTEIISVNGKDFLSLGEAAQLLNASRWTIHRLIKSGKLKAAKIGRRTIISRKAIDNLFN